MGYKFQFVTLAGFHALNLSMFDLALDYEEAGMGAYSRFQEMEFARGSEGYRGVEHQAFVGTGSLDAMAQVIAGGPSSVTALTGSTEGEHFCDSVAGGGGRCRGIQILKKPPISPGRDAS